MLEVLYPCRRIATYFGDEGEFLGGIYFLFGPRGTGKTTLSRTATALLCPDHKRHMIDP